MGWEATGCPRAPGLRADKVSVGRTQSLPRPRPSARPAGADGHMKQARLAEGRAPYGCLQSLCGPQARVARRLPSPQSQPRLRPSVRAARPLSGGKVGTLHGVEPVDGVPHAGLQGAHVRGAEKAVAEAGEGGIAVDVVEDGVVP